MAELELEKIARMNPFLIDGDNGPRFRESERRFRAMIDALPTAIYTTDADGRLTHFNPAAVEFSGRTPELGTDHWCVSWKLYHTDGRRMPHGECPMAVALKEGVTLRGPEAIAERPDGKRIWFEAYPSPLRDSSGKIIGGINMLIDVTERKESEKREQRMLEEAQAARAEAEEANLAKTQFLTTMSHELRTPLNAIGGYTDLLGMGIHGPVTDEQQESLRRIRQNQEMLLSLINDVLNFARIDAGRLVVRSDPVQVGRVIEGLEALIAPQLGAKGISFVLGPCDDDLITVGDAERIRQILLNLLTNAVKFSNSGDQIRVAAECAGGQVLIQVTDSGHGIPAEKLEVIFDPFIQVDRRRNLAADSQQGVGLGLAISRELARCMGGDLTASSTPGEGSVFTLTLPHIKVSSPGPRGS
ncbi:MAG TPA: ATP-binding protein [Longimicrobiaceae bacterium]|nr:ATP-binding protein [Longimicrobiaceae bacterium]